ncbi:MAG: amidohydrolase [Tissierellia bacterium]|nr:amidohydrolase [Tissierellia bacterium]
MLIKNCSLKYTKYDEGLYDILIENGKIKEIGKDLQKESAIDAKGAIVTAGLIEPHCHMGVYDTATPEGIDGNEYTNPITIGLRGIDALNFFDSAYDVALRNGITTLVCGPGSANIMGGSFAAVKSFGRDLKKRIVKAETTLKMALGENPKFAYGKKGKAPSTRMMSAALMRENLYKAKEYWQKYKAHKLEVDAGKNPQQFNYDLNLHSLMRVFDGMIVKIHAHQADDIMTAVRISEEFGINYTIDHCTEGHLIIDFLKEHNTKAILGPVLGGKSKFEVRNKSLKNAGIFEKAGLFFAIMTDHPVIPVECQRMQISQLIKYGLSRQMALDAITKNAAIMTGIEDRVGSIEIGKDGDIVIWDSDPFDTFSHAKMVIVDGELAYENWEDRYDVDYKCS